MYEGSLSPPEESAAATRKGGMEEMDTPRKQKGEGGDKERGEGGEGGEGREAEREERG